MGKRSKTGVLKRMREIKKAEKAALKREEMRERKDKDPVVVPTVPGDQVATAEDLAGYGFPTDEDDEEQSETG